MVYLRKGIVYDIQVVYGRFTTQVLICDEDCQPIASSLWIRPRNRWARVYAPAVWRDQFAERVLKAYKRACKRDDAKQARQW